jgi:AbrB family looped-hinge helix DNA binding protein
MTQISATITQRGQVTLPSEVRRLLGVGPRDRVMFTIEGPRVTITPEPFTIDWLFGSIKPVAGAPTEIDEQIRLANEDQAERLIAELAENDARGFLIRISPSAF